MFTFHKPKVFRSANGCCICKAKSSSSRFTDSMRYEHLFKACFDLSENRCGEICNACVLLVKRFTKLPKNSDRNWSHVVDARSGPGTKSMVKNGKKSAAAKNNGDSNADTPEKVYKRKHVYKKKNVRKNKATVRRRVDVGLAGGVAPVSDAPSSSSMSLFLDPTYWKRETICCGVIFRGAGGEAALDMAHYRPCSNCGRAEAVGSTNGGTTAPSTATADVESKVLNMLERKKASASASAATKLAEGAAASSSAAPATAGAVASTSSSSSASGSSDLDEGFFDKPVVSPTGSDGGGSGTPAPSEENSAGEDEEDEDEEEEEIDDDEREDDVEDEEMGEDEEEEEEEEIDDNEEQHLREQVALQAT